MNTPTILDFLLSKGVTVTAKPFERSGPSVRMTLTKGELKIVQEHGFLPDSFDTSDTLRQIVYDANSILAVTSFENWEHGFATKREAREAYRRCKAEAKTLLKMLDGDLETYTELAVRDEEFHFGSDAIRFGKSFNSSKVGVC